MTEIKQTFCRICEPFCPMLATVNDEGKVTELAPNPDHPCKGTPCHKGLSFLEVHNDPDRLNWPLKRSNPRTQPQGEFERVEWQQALSEAGAKLQAIRDESGNNAVAVYIGNPPTFNSRAYMLAQGLPGMIGSGMKFGAGTQDCMNKASVAAAVYGSLSLMAPDIYNTDYLLCVGANPKISHWTIMSVPNDAGSALKAIKARGGKIRFVNPRNTESSTSETGDTLLIKPDSDVYFLAALLNEIHQQGGFDEQVLENRGKHVSELVTFVRNYPAERVAEVTGIEAATIREVASEVIAAKSAAFYLSTGVCQGRQGSLGYWLTEMLNFVTGNLGREGGAYRPNGFANAVPAATVQAPVETSLGDIKPAYGMWDLPVALLPDLIESGDIRGLINIGGNPLITAPGEEKLRAALEKLDTIVSIDISHNPMAELSDYVLPACDWLERADINLLANGMQMVPYVHYTDAVVAPTAERRDDWWILSRLLQELGEASPLDEPEHRGGMKFLDDLLSPSELTVAQLQAKPQQTVMLEQGARDSVFDISVQHEDQRLDCLPDAFVEAGLLERCATIFDELQNEQADTLKLISLRTNYMHNSWLSNVEKFRRGRQAVNPLNICAEDAEARGLFEGDAIRVFNQYGSIETQVLINNDLRPGAVAMSHGYGHQRGYKMRVANDKPGANYNQLLPGTDNVYAFEPFSAMAWMCGVPVDVEKAASVN